MAKECNSNAFLLYLIMPNRDAKVHIRNQRLSKNISTGWLARHSELSLNSKITVKASGFYLLLSRVIMKPNWPKELSLSLECIHHIKHNKDKMIILLLSTFTILGKRECWKPGTELFLLIWDFVCSLFQCKLPNKE